MSWIATLIESNNTSEQFFRVIVDGLLECQRQYLSIERVLFKQNKYIYNIGILNKVITTLNMQTALICKNWNLLVNNIARNENVWVP